MATRYNVSSYRPPVCQNEFCEWYGKIIPLDHEDVRHMLVGQSWRTFCPECGDGAGWTLDSVEWDKTSHIDELILNLRIQLGPQKDPVGNGVSKPYWIHDCEKCVWLGSRQIGDSHLDFYWCSWADSAEIGTGIIRRGNDADNNESYLFSSIQSWIGDEDPRCACYLLRKLVLKHIHA
jgi:hypothetical protein